MSFGRFTGNIPTVNTVGKGTERSKLERSSVLNVGPGDNPFQLEITVSLTASPRKGHTGKWDPGTRGSLKVAGRRFPAVNVEVIAYVLAAFGGPTYAEVVENRTVVEAVVGQLIDSGKAEDASAVCDAFSYLAGHHAFSSVAAYAATLKTLEDQIIEAHDEQKSRYGGETAAYHKWLSGFEYTR